MVKIGQSRNLTSDNFSNKYLIDDKITRQTSKWSLNFKCEVAEINDKSNKLP